MAPLLPPRIPTSSTSPTAPTPKGFNDNLTPHSGASASGSSRPNSRPSSRSSSPFFGIITNTSFEKMLGGVGGGSVSVGSFGSSTVGSNNGSRGGSRGSTIKVNRQPPPMPLTSTTESNNANKGHKRKSNNKGGNNNKSNVNINKSNNNHSRNNNSNSADIMRDLPPLLSQSSTMSRSRNATPIPPTSNTTNTNTTLPHVLSHPPPLLSPHRVLKHTIQPSATDEAMTMPFCGGMTAAIKCDFPNNNNNQDNTIASLRGSGSHSRNNSGGSGTFSRGGSPIKKRLSDSLGGSNSGTRLFGSMAEADVETYAMHHDEIVTALIDEALRNSTSTSSGNEKTTAATANANITSPTSVTNAEDDLQNTDKSSRSVALSSRSIASETASISASNAGKGSNSKPRSPYRMKRNQPSGGGSTSSKTRKRPAAKSKTAAPTPAATAQSPTRNAKTTIIDPADFFHPDCILQKEKSDVKKPRMGFGMNHNANKNSGNNTSNKGDDANAPSAVGREQTLAKLKKKLSMLGDIESGKFGKAAEMLRSDAVAYALHPMPHQTQMYDDVMLATDKLETKVETRSILTLRMGFVSMSYGILLQWDCACGLVELIVLRKMCRDDFLKRKGSNGQYERSASVMSVSNSRRGAGTISSATNVNASSLSSREKPPLVPKNNNNHNNSSSNSNSHNKPENVIPMPKLLVDRSSHSHDEVTAEMTSSSEPTSQSLIENARRSAMHLPKIHLPPNPLAGLPKMLHSALLGSPSARPQSFLSVSVLNVKKLHGGCPHCQSPMTMGGVWSSMVGRNNPSSDSKNTTTTTSKNSNRNNRRRGKRKRKHTIRPYVRFVLGKHEHNTKITKFNSGHPIWTKRHFNSCLLPCPPEELRWFAGQEDLVVEVRNNWKSSTPYGSVGGGKISARQHIRHRKNNANNNSSSNSNGQSIDDPILAMVNVPLSSINIEDEDDRHIKTTSCPADDDEQRGTWKRRTTKDGASSTDVTIPLRMSCCGHAQMGSISLKITIKVPAADLLGPGSAKIASSIPSALAKPNIQVLTTADSQGGERVNESIELGPLTRLMDGWSGLGLSVSRDDTLNKESEAAPVAQAPKTDQKKSSAPLSPKRSPKNNNSSTPNNNTTRNSNNNGGGGKIKRMRLRWSKRFDPQTKKWSTLRPNTNNDGSTRSKTRASSAAPVIVPPPSKQQQKPDEVETTSNDGNDGWFAFLNR